jgi:Flp pilus assembly pilin Flp
MIRKVRGASLVEYVVVVVLLVALVGGALLGLTTTLSHKLSNVYVDIGS